MTPGLWILVAAGLVVGCIVVCDAIARTDEAARRKAGTLEDPRVAHMVVRQRAYGRRLRRDGRSILDPKKRYTPAVGEAASLKPHAQVYAIKGGKR